MTEPSAKGLTNADFARIFRQESRQEAKEAEAVEGDEQEDRPRGLGGIDFGGASRRDFLARGEPLSGSLDGAQSGEQERGADADAEDDVNAARGGLGLGADSRRSGGGLGFQGFAQQSEVSDESKKKKDVPAMSKAQLANLGKWEKHTKGFGLKMLAKMGFKGRLGKDESGVSSTIEVVQRPALMGIGYGNFTEASALKHNRKIARELKGETVVEEATRKREEAEGLVEDDTLWRKRKAPEGTKKYKRAADVSHDAQAAKKKARSDVILDMRGPDVRVLSNVSDAYEVDAQKLEAAKPKLGEELIYNVRMVVNLSQGQIYDLTSKIDTNTENVASLKKEAKLISAQVEMETVRLRHIEEMMQQMKQLEQVAEAAHEAQNVESIVTLLSDIRASFPQEFEAYKLHQLVPSLCIAPLKALLTSLSLSDANARSTSVQQYRLIQVFLLKVPVLQDNKAAGGGVFHHYIREKVNSAGDDMYNLILEETLWPAVSQFVTYQWNVKESPEDCLDFLALFRPHLSPAFESAFLRQLVLPRLKKECQRWNPQTDTVLIHDWLLPWRPILGDNAMELLYPDIRLTLANALNVWHPSDLSVLTVLSPWKTVWGESEYAKFTHRHVIRKLIRCLHRDFEINPQNQSLEALTWVLAWKDHLPERQFVALFEGEFFPKWLKVLRRWVTESPNLMELEKWYRGWKSFFQKQQLANHHQLIIHFHGALVLLEAAADNFGVVDGDLSGRAIPALNKNAPSNYQEALVKARNEDPTTAEDGEGSGSTSVSSAFEHLQKNKK
uniref:G-patch domain-containing protein n=1 Tax=Globisporangium ultimum (strain ATCC 200006 / CBS 805.95 / DAOM BR144) TaxID=431595 RepID=K3WKH7_GLOUD